MKRSSEQVAGGGAPPLRALEDVYRSNIQMVDGDAAARLGRAEGEDVAGEVFQAAALAFAGGRADHVTPPWLMAVTLLGPSLIAGKGTRDEPSASGTCGSV
jgi:hypothetical protein